LLFIFPLTACFVIPYCASQSIITDTSFFLLGRHISCWNFSDWIEVVTSATLYSCMGYRYRIFRETCAAAVLRTSNLLLYDSADMLLYVSSAACEPSYQGNNRSVTPRFLYPEDGCSILFRMIGKHMPSCIASNSRIQ
jgi:hypothetical protein